MFANKEAKSKADVAGLDDLYLLVRWIMLLVQDADGGDHELVRPFP